jgi:hypothetical protein
MCEGEFERAAPQSDFVTTGRAWDFVLVVFLGWLSRNDARIGPIPNA